MSQDNWIQFNALLSNMFSDVNTGATPTSPRQLYDTFRTQLHALQPLLPGQFVELGHNLWIPQSYEVVRLLSNLRQRLNRTAGTSSPQLVEQLRAETLIRRRPIRNLELADMKGPVGKVLAQIGGKPRYSRFQYSGWEKVWQTIESKDHALVIVAPTGSGKTEVFLLPAIHYIARNLAQQNPPRYVIIYPRVALLKDQLSRIFRYVHRAMRISGEDGQKDLFGQPAFSTPFVIGMQFSGVLANHSATRESGQIFDNDGVFLTVPKCPICEDNQRDGMLRYHHAQDKVVRLKCTNAACDALFHVTLGKNDHADASIKPHILVTTIESLDRLYLNPKLEEYISNIQGLMFDEVHLYHSLYGAHVHNVLKRIEKIQKHNGPIFKVASSATVSNPSRFASKLFFGDDNDPRVEVHDARGYPDEPAGIENIIFLQTTEADFPRTQSTLIQTVMAVGHGVLGPNERTIVFTESIDHADRSVRQIRDAESQGQLWRFRTIKDEVFFENKMCPSTSPSACLTHYLVGECWRGIRGGLKCHTSNVHLVERPLDLSVIHSKESGDYWSPDVLVATPVLEVGVDDERFRATIHYRPPRSVFSFLQRRGRAGRGLGDTAYTILVLGRSPADEFYFRRRNRLMDPGKYELPLNPDNEVIRQMHEQIETERHAIGEIHDRTRNLSSAILLWMVRKYRKCQTLSRLFGAFLGSVEHQLLNASRHQEQQKQVMTWVKSNFDQFRRYMELDILLRELVTRMPEVEREKAIRFRDLVHEYRNDKLEDLDALKSVALDLIGTLNVLYLDEEESFQAEMYQRLIDIITTITKDQKQIGKFQGNSSLISALYDFFGVLHSRFIEEPAQFSGTINRTEDTIKIVMQSLFYIGNYCLEAHPSCHSCLSYFTPDTYFQEVKPIAIEAWSNLGKSLDEMYMEDVTKLGTMLLPYKTFYRYFSSIDSMAVVRTTTQSDWVEQTQNGTIVRIELHVEGKRQSQGVDPHKVHVVPIKPDAKGLGIVKLCRNCFRLHSESFRGNCKCGSSIVPVRLRAEPIIHRDAQYEIAHRLSDTLYYCDRLEGIVKILGAEVEFAIQKSDLTMGYVPTSRKEQFRALYYRAGEYPEPVVYSLHTRGIIWDLKQVVSSLSRDESLKRQLEPYGKKLGADLILHTAAHLLHKAVSAISGVNDIVLEYAILHDKMQVVIWERYEGGVGISEIIKDTILEDPKVLYRELLAPVLCPVFFSEDAHWMGSDEAFRNHLMERWALTDSDDLLLVDGVVQECVAERKAIAERRAEPQGACSEHDGCPACVHTTVCTEHLEQPEKVSRYVAEAIMNYFRLQVDGTTLNAMNSLRFDNGISPVVRLRDDLMRDLFDVVRF